MSPRPPPPPSTPPSASLHWLSSPISSLLLHLLHLRLLLLQFYNHPTIPLLLQLPYYSSSSSFSSSFFFLLHYITLPSSSPSSGSPPARVVWMQGGKVMDANATVTPSGTTVNDLQVPASRRDLRLPFTCQASNNDVTAPLVANHHRNVSCECPP